MSRLFPVIPPLPEGFLFQDGCITREEEAQLLAEITRLSFNTVELYGVVAKRRVVQYGWSYSFATDRITAGESLPTFLLPLRARIGTIAELPAEDFSEAIVTEYQPGTPIGWHRDRPHFDVIAGISLASTCRMRLRPVDGSEPPRALELPPRSLYIMRGIARHAWEHSIPPVPALRYSITFRTMAPGALQRGR